ncbi:MAG: hypothetical protein J6M53_02180 [Bacteroidaceae bacterium]|nr:hypothetical protein [Bacteroidaceae bacterium]
MKRILILLAVVLAGFTAQAQEEGGQRGGRGGDPRQGVQRMAERMAKELKLDKNVKEWFVPLYVEYRDTLMAVQRQKRVEEKELNNMDDEAVNALIEQSLQNEANALSLKREYLAKFREKLTAKQLYRVLAGQRPRGGDQQRQRGNGEEFQGGPGGPGGFPGGGPGF